VIAKEKNVDPEFKLFSLSDRLAVLFRGRIAGVFTPEETSVLEVGFLMTVSKEA